MDAPSQSKEERTNPESGEDLLVHSGQAGSESLRCRPLLRALLTCAAATSATAIALRLPWAYLASGSTALAIALYLTTDRTAQ